MAPMTAPAPDSIAIEVEVTLPDIEAFNLHIAFSPRLRTRWMRQFVAIYLVVLLLLLALNWLTFGLGEFDWLVHVLVPVLIVAVFALVMTPASFALHRWNVRRAVRAMVGQPAREASLGRKRIEAGAQGISLTGANSTSHYGWAAVTGLQETPDLMLVMLGEMLAIVIPRRGQDEARLAALGAMVRARMAGGA